MSNFQTIGQRPIREIDRDKVTGAAVFGNDVTLPGTLVGLVLRSPHAHARIRAIDTRKALKVKGVKAVITNADFPELRTGGAGDIAKDNLAWDKVLFHGHGVAAVAATSTEAANKALKKIRVDYEVLPHVTDLEAAMADDAPILDATLGYEGHEGPSNIYEHVTQSHGDVAAGFSEADVVLERTYRTPTVHQGYIEPTACLATFRNGGQSTIWTTTQGHFGIRDSVALMCGLATHELKVIPTEIGGGFGGKTTAYLEAIALMLSKQAGRPVSMRMSREEVFRCAGPGAASRIRVRIGAKRDGTITAMEADLAYEAGATPGAPLGGGMRSMFGAYDVPNIRMDGVSVVLNKPKVRAYRGPGAPQACFAVESLLNELAGELQMDPHRAASEERGVQRRDDGIRHFRHHRFRRMPGGSQKLRSLHLTAAAGAGPGGGCRFLVQRRWQLERHHSHAPERIRFGLHGVRRSLRNTNGPRHDRCRNPAHSLRPGSHRGGRYRRCGQYGRVRRQPDGQRHRAGRDAGGPRHHQPGQGAGSIRLERAAGPGGVAGGPPDQYHPGRVHHPA